jgi:phosphohistidine phosphatase SixA
MGEDKNSGAEGEGKERVSGAQSDQGRGCAWCGAQRPLDLPGVVLWTQTQAAAARMAGAGQACARVLCTHKLRFCHTTTNNNTGSRLSLRAPAPSPLPRTTCTPCRHAQQEQQSPTAVAHSPALPAAVHCQKLDQHWLAPVPASGLFMHTLSLLAHGTVTYRPAAASSMSDHTVFHMAGPLTGLLPASASPAASPAAAANSSRIALHHVSLLQHVPQPQ